MQERECQKQQFTHINNFKSMSQAIEPQLTSYIGSSISLSLGFSY